MVSILVSMPPSEETPFRHSVQERMASERRRIKHSSTYTETGRIFTTNIQNMYIVKNEHRFMYYIHRHEKKKKTPQHVDNVHRTCTWIS